MIINLSSRMFYAVCKFHQLKKGQEEPNYKILDVLQNRLEPRARLSILKENIQLKVPAFQLD